MRAMLEALMLVAHEVLRDHQKLHVVSACRLWRSLWSLSLMAPRMVRNSELCYIQEVVMAQNMGRTALH